MSLPKYHRIKKGNFYISSLPLYNYHIKYQPKDLLIEVLDLHSTFNTDKLTIMLYYLNNGESCQSSIKRNVLREGFVPVSKDEAMVWIL
jgi:hypothetical protein